MTVPVHLAARAAPERRQLATTLAEAGWAVHEHADAFGFLGAHDGEAPAVLLADLRLDGLGGVELLEHLRDAAVPVYGILLIEPHDAPVFAAALRAGVRDLLTRPVGTVTLLNAVAQAQTAFDRTAPAAPEIELSPREKTCLECTARGLTAAQTAREAGIAAATVNYHLQRAAGKLGVSGKHQAVLQAVRLGLIAATEQGQNPAN
jgi:two-component system, LuxR family, response regulator FixJ